MIAPRRGCSGWMPASLPAGASSRTSRSLPAAARHQELCPARHREAATRRRHEPARPARAAPLFRQKGECREPVRLWRRFSPLPGFKACLPVGRGVPFPFTTPTACSTIVLPAPPHRPREPPSPTVNQDRTQTERPSRTRRKKRNRKPSNNQDSELRPNPRLPRASLPQQQRRLPQVLLRVHVEEG